jgi:hypothetical protein
MSLAESASGRIRKFGRIYSNWKLEGGRARGLTIEEAAETAHVVATLLQGALDNLDSVLLRRVMENAESGGTVETDS